MKLTFLMMTAVLVSGCAVPTSQKNCCECPSAPCQETVCCDPAGSGTSVHLQPATPLDQVVLPPVASNWGTVEPSDHRLEALEEDLRKLEIQRQYEQAHQSQLEKEVQSMSAQVARLNDDVDHWREQVVRLEDEAITQHTLDLESLEKLSNLVEKVSVSEGTDQPSTNE